MSQHRANYKKAPIFLGLERTRKKSSADWKRTSTSEYYQDALGYTRQRCYSTGIMGLLCNHDSARQAVDFNLWAGRPTSLPV